MTSDLHTWNKPFDLNLATLLQKYYGPNGIWWNVDIDQTALHMATTSVHVAGSRQHHRGLLVRKSR